MAEESETGRKANVLRRIEDTARGDLDAALAVYSEDAVWDFSPVGLGTYVGKANIRRLIAEWTATYDDFAMELMESVPISEEVTLAVMVQSGRPHGSTARVSTRYTAVTTWADGMAVLTTNYIDPDEARAAAERLAKERADG